MNYCIILLFSFISSCSINDKQRDEKFADDFQFENKNVQTWDSIYTSYDLKNGYRLLYIRENDRNFAVLVKNNIVKKIRETDSRMSLNILGHLYADYLNNFIICYRFGSNPFQIEVYNKQSGLRLAEGFDPFYVDTLKEIMMFESNDNLKLILYNLKSEKSESFNAPEDNSVLAEIRWKVLELTDTEIKIQYFHIEGDRKKEMVITFKREKNRN